MGRKRRQCEAPPSEPRNDNARSQTETETSESGSRRTRPRRTRASYRHQTSDPTQEAVALPEIEDPILNNDEENPAEEEEIDNELTCALCHDLFVNPVASPCGHAFCNICHLRLFSVRLPGEPAVPPAQRVRPCPLCREKHKKQDTIAQTSLDTRARTQHPELYSKRSIEVAAAVEQFNNNQPHYFTLTVGNTCENVPTVRTRSGISRPSGRSDWQFFVELRDGHSGEDVDASVYIDQVVMHLCGGEGREVCSAPPYVTRRSSNGAIRRMCYAIVYFKPHTGLQPVAVTWLLNMNPGRHCLDVPLELCRRQEDENGGENGDGPARNFDHFASVTGPVVRGGDGPGLISQEGPVAGLGSLYPVLAGLLETFIRMDTVSRRNA